MASGGGHSAGHDGVSALLDEIDMLVDEQLTRGQEHSDTFHGARYRENHPCPWCTEGWHFLPITQHMQAMRRGSYAQDEFGQGIVDPDYRYQDDESGVVCPGSEFHGPADRWGTWDKQSRERAASRPHVARSAHHPRNVRANLPPGRVRRLRFVGPFEPWTIALDDEREVEDIYSNPALVGMSGHVERRSIIRSQRLTATFSLNAPLLAPDSEWLNDNRRDIEDMSFARDARMYVHMRDVVIPFREFEVYATAPNQAYPDWVEFETSYQIEQHPWFMHFWTMSGTEDNPTLAPAHPVSCDCPEEGHHPLCTALHRGHESNYVIIDEAYEMPNEELERLQPYVDQVEGIRITLAQEAGISPGLLEDGASG